MDWHLIFAGVSAIVSAAFSAGMAYAAIRVIGESVKELRADVKTATDKMTATREEHGDAIAKHETRIAVVENQVGSLKAMRTAPWARNGKE